MAEGYEDTRQAREANPLKDVGTSPWNPRPKIEPIRAGVGAANERDLAVSRGGDVGETPG